jgi:hypothetical protein
MLEIDFMDKAELLCYHYWLIADGKGFLLARLLGVPNE